MKKTIVQRKRGSALRSLGLVLALLSAVACDDFQYVSPEDLLPPEPEDYKITVSSPGGDGLISVTGRRAVPGNYSVLVEVQNGNDDTDIEASASENDVGALWLTPGAAARDEESPATSGISAPRHLGYGYGYDPCLDNYSQCPSLTNRRCYAPSDGEGNFTLQAPADMSSTVSVRYVNPVLCYAVSVFNEAEVDDGIVPLDLFAYDMAVDADARRVYVAGKNRANDGNDNLRILDLATFEETATYLIEGVPTPKRVDIFRESSGNAFFFIGGDQAGLVGPISDPDVIDEDAAFRLVGDNGNPVQNVSFLSANAFNSDDFATCTGLGDGAADYDYTRAFFTDGENLYFHEFSGSLSTGGTGAVNASAMSINLSGLDFEFVDASGRNYAVEEIAFAKLVDDPLVIGSRFYLVAKLSGGGAESYYFFGTDFSDIDFCGTTTLALADGYNLGDDEDGVSVSLFDGYGVYSSSVKFLGVLRKNEQKVTLLDTETFSNVRNYALDYANRRAYDEGTGDNVYALNSEAPISAIAGFSRPEDEIEELLLLGSDLGGSDFLVYNNVRSVFEPDLPPFSFTTRDTFFNEDAEELYILDSGISSESSYTNNSLIRIYNLDPFD